VSAYKVVYSTGAGPTCKRCGHPQAACACAAASRGKAGDGIVRIRLEKKGRGGKAVTTIAGLPLSAADLRAWASGLKKACGSGGSVKDGVVEIQGDHRQRVLADLAARGYQAKLAGG
jgi:translation initiation factor 1